MMINLGSVLVENNKFQHSSHSQFAKDQLHKVRKEE